MCWQDRRSVGKMLPFKDAVDLARRKHGGKFKYIEQSYRGVKYKMSIVCPQHGIFEQRLADHIKAVHGCEQCSGLHLMGLEEFIKKATDAHDGFYSYEKTDYRGNKHKLTVTCPEHGDFKIQPNAHLSGQGCPDCGNIKKGVSQRLSQSEFIKRAKEIHSNRYDLSRARYQGNSRKVTIGCPEHGDFEIAPNKFIDRRQGCGLCGKLNSGWRRSEYVSLAKQRHQGRSNLYLVEFSLEDEIFYKVGITFYDTDYRFRYSKIEYRKRDLIIMDGDAEFIWDLEKRLHRMLKDSHYLPKRPFAGSATECFSQVPNSIFNMLRRFKNTDQLQLIA